MNNSRAESDGSPSFQVHYEEDAWTRACKDDAGALLALLLSSECRHPCGYPAGTVDPALLDKWPSIANVRKKLLTAIQRAELVKPGGNFLCCNVS